MTPLQVNTAARQRYNVVNDSFFADTEIYLMMDQAAQELVAEALLIERVYTTPSVASQQEYALPTNAIAVKRITYDGKKLAPFTFREDDILTIMNQAVTSTGIPSEYATWDGTVYLRPIPAVAALTIKIFAYVQPQPVTVTSTLEIPSQYHMALVNFLIAAMATKDKNYSAASFHYDLWEKDKARIKRLEHKKKRGDSFAVVKNIDIFPQTTLGNW